MTSRRHLDDIWMEGKPWGGEGERHPKQGGAYFRGEKVGPKGLQGTPVLSQILMVESADPVMNIDPSMAGPSFAMEYTRQQWGVPQTGILFNEALWYKCSRPHVTGALLALWHLTRWWCVTKLSGPVVGEYVRIGWAIFISIIVSPPRDNGKHTIVYNRGLVVGLLNRHHRQGKVSQWTTNFLVKILYERWSTIPLKMGVWDLFLGPFRTSCGSAKLKMSEKGCQWLGGGNPDQREFVVNSF